MSHALYKQDVYLDEDSHRYFDYEHREYMSFSRLYNFLVPKFDAQNVSRWITGGDEQAQEALLDQWQEATDEGTRIDKALELYAKNGLVLETDKDIAPVVKKVLEKYSVYNKCYEQLVVFNKAFRTAGSSDKCGVHSNRKTSDFDMSDFKCFEKGISYEPKGQKWLNAPFDYLPNTKYTKISFQLSYYAWHLEQLTGRKCRRLFIDLIQPKKNDEGKVVAYSNTQVPVQYMKHQVELLLDTFKDRILSELDPVSNTVVIDNEEYF